MSESRDRDQVWLRAIAEHPETTEADYTAAEAILADKQLTFEQRNSDEVRHLEDLLFLYVEPGGTWGRK
jgi:hypothetical protein